MKILFLTLALILTASAFAAETNPKNCFTIKNDLDRKYCADKYLETVKGKLKAEKKTWAKGLAGNVKADKAEVLETEIQAKKDELALLSAEVALHEKQLQDLTAVKELTPAPKKQEKKKEKPKLPFGIKL